MSAFLFIRRSIETTNIETSTVNDDVCNGEECEFVKVKGNLFFGAAPMLKNVLDNLPKTHKAIDIDMRDVAFIDATGAKELREFVAQAKEKGIEVYITGVNPRIKHVLDKLDRKHADLYGHLYS